MPVSIRRPFSVGLVLLCALVGGLLVFSARAFAVVPETPETIEATTVTNGTAQAHGILNPASEEEVEYYFAYKAGAECTGGSKTPVARTKGNKVEVSASLKGLAPGTKYAVCLVAQHALEEAPVEEAVGNAVSFTTTSLKPVVSEESFSDVGSTEALLSAKIGAAGSSTTFKVTYGTGESSGSSAEVSLGAPEAAVGVLSQLRGLKPDIEYHFRFVAHNAFGDTQGAEMSFTTAQSLGPAEMGLPDSRAYEQVSPAAKQEVYVPEQAGSAPEDITTARPFRASAAGDTVAYVGAPPGSGEGGSGNFGKGSGDEYLASRNAERGWQASDVTPANSTVRYEAFSADLSLGFMRSFNLPPEFAPSTSAVAENPDLVGCEITYAQSSDGAFHALFTTTTTPGFCGGEFNDGLFAGGSADGVHQLVQSSAALIPEAQEALGEGSDNLYDSVDGHLRSVNVVNGNAEPNATFGAPADGVAEDPPNFSNVISEDGSRIFWTDLNDNHVYARINGAQTVALSSGPAKYWTATPAGRYAFYTEAGALERFNLAAFESSAQPEAEALAAAREELAGGMAGVQGVIGASTDGSIVYFVADAVLGDGAVKDASPGICKEARNTPEEEEEFREEQRGILPAGRGCNLYEYHEGQPIKFIAQLSPKDDEMPLHEQQGPDNNRRLGDWRTDVGSRTAEVTPDGQHLAFLSQQPLTGYDNFERPSVLEPNNPARVAELFNYDSTSGELVCASCDASGSPPIDFRPGSPETVKEGGAIVPVSFASTYMPRWLADDGARIYFDTVEPLVPQDTNRRLDVYEWERAGEGGCVNRRGCIYLLSRGDAPDASYLVDASANGNDVFLATRAQLVPSDRDAKIDLYDARVDGGFPEVSLACTGTGCQGVPPAPPIFATPSSVTFNGVGNFPLPAAKPGPSKPKTAAQVRADNLAKALRACRKDKKKAKRMSCERNAQRRYGAVKKKAKRADNKRRAK